MPWVKTGPIDYFYATRNVNGKNEYFYVGRGAKVDEYFRCLANGEEFKLPPSQADEIRLRHRAFNAQAKSYYAMVKQEIEIESIAMGFHKNNSEWTIKRMKRKERDRLPKPTKAERTTRKTMKQTITSISHNLQEMTIGSIPLESEVQQQLISELEGMKARLKHDGRPEIVKIAIDQLVTAYAAHFVASHELYTRPINNFEPREKLHLERQYHKTLDNLHRATVLVAAIEQRVNRVPLAISMDELPDRTPRPHHQPNFVEKSGRLGYTVWPEEPDDVHWKLTDGDIPALQKRNSELHGFLAHYDANPGSQPSDILFVQVTRTPLPPFPDSSSRD